MTLTDLGTAERIALEHPLHVEGVVARFGLVEVDRRRVDVLSLFDGRFIFLYVDGTAAGSANDGGGGCLLWDCG